VPIPRGHPGAAGTDNSEPVLDAGPYSDNRD
jgi:hypothetical protein